MSFHLGSLRYICHSVTWDEIETGSGFEDLGFQPSVFLYQDTRYKQRRPTRKCLKSITIGYTWYYTAFFQFLNLCISSYVYFDFYLFPEVFIRSFISEVLIFLYNKIKFFKEPALGWIFNIVSFWGGKNNYWVNKLGLKNNISNWAHLIPYTLERGDTMWKCWSSLSSFS